jgi:hypothetical protein
VFRWVGVAAPAQRCFQGLSLPSELTAQYRSDCGPGSLRFFLRRVAGKRPLMHSGGGLNARAAMAWPPYQSPARAKPEASDLLIGNPSGHRSTPLSAGRLRMPLLSDFMVHRARAVGKRKMSWRSWQLPKASPTLRCHQHHPPRGDLRCWPKDPCVSEAEGSDSQCLKCAVPQAAPQFAGANSGPCCGRYATSWA